jgi:hypothetical protein
MKKLLAALSDAKLTKYGIFGTNCAGRASLDKERIASLNASWVNNGRRDLPTKCILIEKGVLMVVLLVGVVENEMLMPAAWHNSRQRKRSAAQHNQCKHAVCAVCEL